MLEVQPIPAFQDNYIWMLHAPDAGETWVVDPGDAGPVEAALEASGRTLDGILITHHHWDHTGGLPKLLAGRDIPVFGPRNPAIRPVTRRFGDGDRFELFGLEVQVIATPGHTLDHICFLFPAHQPPLLFCGDTLFAGGCGRLFEGTPEQMHTSLAKLAALPTGTQVHCAHEYTLANLDFASAVEPENAAIRNRIAACQARRERQEPTLPCEIGEELATNPFLRAGAPGVRAAAEAAGLEAGSSEVEVFAAIRAWKDRF